MYSKDKMYPRDGNGINGSGTVPRNTTTSSSRNILNYDENRIPNNISNNLESILDPPQFTSGVQRNSRNSNYRETYDAMESNEAGHGAHITPNTSSTNSRRNSTGTIPKCENTNKSKYPDKKQIEDKLEQIREYIYVTSSLMSNMKSTYDEKSDNDELENLEHMIADLRDSEAKLVETLENWDKQVVPIKNEQQLGQEEVHSDQMNLQLLQENAETHMLHNGIDHQTTAQLQSGDVDIFPSTTTKCKNNYRNHPDPKRILKEIKPQANQQRGSIQNIEVQMQMLHNGLGQVGNESFNRQQLTELLDNKDSELRAEHELLQDKLIELQTKKNQVDRLVAQLQNFNGQESDDDVDSQIRRIGSMKDQLAKLKDMLQLAQRTEDLLSHNQQNTTIQPNVESMDTSLRIRNDVRSASAGSSSGLMQALPRRAEDSARMLAGGGDNPRMQSGGNSIGLSSTSNERRRLKEKQINKKSINANERERRLHAELQAKKRELEELMSKHKATSNLNHDGGRGEHKSDGFSDGASVSWFNPSSNLYNYSDRYSSDGDEEDVENDPINEYSEMNISAESLLNDETRLGNQPPAMPQLNYSAANYGKMEKYGAPPTTGIGRRMVPPPVQIQAPLSRAVSLGPASLVPLAADSTSSSFLAAQRGSMSMTSIAAHADNMPGQMNNRNNVHPNSHRDIGSNTQVRCQLEHIRNMCDSLLDDINLASTRNSVNIPEVMAPQTVRQQRNNASSSSLYTEPRQFHNISASDQHMWSKNPHQKAHKPIALGDQSLSGGLPMPGGQFYVLQPVNSGLQSTNAVDNPSESSSAGREQFSTSFDTQVLMNSLNQCCQMIWEQQREIQQLKNAVQCLQQNSYPNQQLHVVRPHCHDDLNDESELAAAAAVISSPGNRMMQSSPSHQFRISSGQSHGASGGYSVAQPSSSAHIHHQNTPTNTANIACSNTALDHHNHAPSHHQLRHGGSGQQFPQFSASSSKIANNVPLLMPANVPGQSASESFTQQQCERDHRRNNNATNNVGVMYANNATSNTIAASLSGGANNAAVDLHGGAVQTMPSDGNLASASSTHNHHQHMWNDRTLNNQVAPGNRANNYWDNFRSYSRQNLLSSKYEPPVPNAGSAPLHHESSRTAQAIPSSDISAPGNAHPLDMDMTHLPSHSSHPPMQQSLQAHPSVLPSVPVAAQPAPGAPPSIPTNAGAVDPTVRLNISIDNSNSVAHLVQPQPSIVVANQQNPHRPQFFDLINDQNVAHSDNEPSMSSSGLCTLRRRDGDGFLARAQQIDTEATGVASAPPPNVVGPVESAAPAVPMLQQHHQAATLPVGPAPPPDVVDLPCINRGNEPPDGYLHVFEEVVAALTLERAAAQAAASIGDDFSNDQEAVAAVGPSGVEYPDRFPAANSRDHFVIGIDGDLMGEGEESSNNSIDRLERASAALRNNWIEGLQAAASAHNSTRSKLFDELRDNVYKEVASFISANNRRPHFLIQLFRDMQMINTDYMRSSMLQSVHSLASQYALERPLDFQDIRGTDNIGELLVAYLNNKGRETIRDVHIAELTTLILDRYRERRDSNGDEGAMGNCEVVPEMVAGSAVTSSSGEFSRNSSVDQQPHREVSSLAVGAALRQFRGQRFRDVSADIMRTLYTLLGAEFPSIGYQQRFLMPSTNHPQLDEINNEPIAGNFDLGVFGGRNIADSETMNTQDHGDLAEADQSTVSNTACTTANDVTASYDNDDDEEEGAVGGIIIVNHGQLTESIPENDVDIVADANAEGLDQVPTRLTTKSKSRSNTPTRY